MDTRIETKCLHEGYEPGNGEARQLPIWQSTTWKYATSDDMGALFDLDAEGYFYTRLQNPTNDFVAAKIAEMRNQSDRNIRKCWNNILKMLQDQSEKGLLCAAENGYALSMREVAFLKNYRKETADK